MTAPTAPLIRRVCETAQQLREEWTEAMTTHDQRLIRLAMTHYFRHLNGDCGHQDPCPKCIKLWEDQRYERIR